MPNPGRAAGTPVARRGAVSTRPGRSTRHGSDGMRRKRYRAVPDPGKAAGSGRRGLAVGMLPSRWTAKRSDGVRPETRRAVPGRGKAAGWRVTGRDTAPCRTRGRPLGPFRPG